MFAFGRRIQRDDGAENRKVGKATWKGALKLSWREAGPPNYQDDTVNSDE